MRIRQVLISATVCVLVAAASSAADASAGAAATPGSVQALVAGMSLEQKVGQLFATYVYGDTATTTDPAYTSQNQAAYGVDNGAQVVDKNTNPANSADGPRSFGDHTGAVAALSAASVLGYQSAGIAATAKHFPGLGSTSINTDNGIAVTDETRAQFDANDLP